MFLESFRHLIEIEALKRENQQNLERIASENKRISDLEERRKKTLAKNEDLRLEEKNLKLDEIQYKIEDWGTRLTKLNSQLSMAVTEKEQIAFESQIATLTNDIAQNEIDYFTKLEVSEDILSQIKDNEEFMKGSLATLEEIKLEVQDSIAKENTVIENRQKRIDSLVELCHPSLKSLYLAVEKKFLPKRPVSYLIDKKCTGCHMMADSMLKNSLEEGRSIETCPNCGRLLIPETAKIY